jgi:LPS export ABC transporter protein LptC
MLYSAKIMTKSNKIRQLLALFVILASLSLVSAIVLKIYRGRVTKELLRNLPKNIDVSLKKIHFTETRDGVKKWDLLADKADYNKGKEVTNLTGVRLVVAAGGKIGDITLTAPRAEYHNITRDVRMDGKVIAKSSSGMEFTTEDAEYIAARGVIVSSGRVTFTDGKLTMEGVGMEFKPETKNIRILNGVTANIEPGAGK